MRKYTDLNPNDPPDRPTWVDGIDNPYLHGPYTPVISEITAVDIKASEGEIPADLYGAYVRNGPNPILEPRGAYHWFDGDGMVHGVYLSGGTASYRNRWVETPGLRHEREAGQALFGGIMNFQLPPAELIAECGVMKNAANTNTIDPCFIRIIYWT